MDEREMRMLKAGEKERKLPALHLSSRKRYAGGAVSVQGVHAANESMRHHSAAPTPRDTHYGMGGGGGMRREGHQGPQATSMPGMLPVIQDVRRAGKGAVGVPGIISSTTLGPNVRRRLAIGIIENPMEAETATGPVHRVAGHDSTAYNEGMVHISGSRYK